VRQPLVNLSAATCQALEAYRDNLLDVTDWQSVGITDETDHQRLQDLMVLKRRVQAKEHQSLLEVFYSLLSITGCVARFERTGDAEALWNLGLLSQLIAAWDEYGSTRNFYPFQEYLKLLKEGGVDPFTVPPEDAVQVMTIHQAKGLEFPVVVLGSAMEGRLPTHERRDRYEIPFEMRASGPPEVDDPHLVDERKLFYVAVTRARDLLIIGTADVVAKRGGGPSRFLREMFGIDLKAVADRSRKVFEAESQVGRHREARKRYSFSDLALYLQCPMRYKFAVVYGFEPPWLDPVNFGASVHRALEVIHQRVLEGRIPEEGDIDAIVAETWVSPRRLEPDLEKQYREAAGNQLRRYVREHGSSLTQVEEPEISFAFSLNDRVLAGKIDLLRRQRDSQVEVVDFKTSEAVVAEKDQVGLQLDLYALGVEDGIGRTVALQTAHFLTDDKVHTHEWSRARKESSQFRLTEVLDSVYRQI
jgi:DNA helicase-2/ATP-dependent DNA helicase PcrA